ncbi:PspC domain-containing protein [Kitasatospora sp. NPDC101183]|uniref:PspC domain-containing protein n=1 Tax=Kitasatospora sp. NPDC101183 TaxID=3364100 RepID=UPI0038275974
MTEDQRIEETGPAAPPEAERPPLTRAERHRVVAGVCGGLGRHLDIDPVVFRVVTVVLCLSGGLGLFLYGLAWLVVPLEGSTDGQGRGGRTELQRVLTGRVDGQSIGAVLLTVIGTGVFFSSMGNGDQMFPLLLLAGLVFLAVRYDPERRRGRRRGRRGGPYDRLYPEGGPYQWPRPDDGEEARARHAAERAAGTVPADSPAPGPSGYLWDPRHPERNPYGGSATPPPVPPAQPWWQRADLPEGDPLRKEGARRPPRAPRPPRRREPAVVRHPRERSPLGFFGFLLAIGAGASVWSVGYGHTDPTKLTTVMLAAGLLVVGLTLLLAAKVGKARKLAAIGLLMTLALTVVGRTPHSMDNAVGDRSWSVATAGDLRDRYNLAAGSIRLDLSALDPAGATLTTKVEVGAGQVTVTVPADVTVNLTATVGLGNVSLPDGRHDGTGKHTYQLDPRGAQASKGTFTLQLGVGLGNIKVVQQ